MAYSDYGAFVYLNGERRSDKEDVGVYDTDEASPPSGLRVYANIISEWWQRLQDTVTGEVDFADPKATFNAIADLIDITDE